MLVDMYETTKCPECGTVYPGTEGAMFRIMRALVRWRRSKRVTIMHQEFDRASIPHVARMFDTDPESAKKTISSRAFLWHDGSISGAVQAIESDLSGSSR